MTGSIRGTDDGDTSEKVVIGQTILHYSALWNPADGRNPRKRDKILEKLGENGMGVGCRAKDRNLKSYGAPKLHSQHTSIDEDKNNVRLGLLHLLMKLTIGIFLLVHNVVFAQSDTLVCVNPRVGYFIDHQERKYFELFPGIPDSDKVFVRLANTDSRSVYIISSVHLGLTPVNVDSTYLWTLSQTIEFREEIIAKSRPGKSYMLRDRWEGSVAEIVLKSGEVLEAELLFADVHGIVVADSTLDVIPASKIRSVRIPYEFSAGTLAGMATGIVLGAIFFGSGIADVNASAGVLFSAFFSVVGGVGGLLFDLVGLALGATKILGEDDVWEPSVVAELQAESRYPLGSQSLKLLLAKAEKE